MRYILLIMIILLTGLFRAEARSGDSLFLTQGFGGWAILHKVRAGETPQSIARCYFAPAAVFMRYNYLMSGDSLLAGRTVFVPFGAHNRISQPPGRPDTARPLYYRVMAGDRLNAVSQSSGLSPRLLSAWNKLSAGTLVPGKIIAMGWVRYDPGAVPPPPKQSSGGKMVVRMETPKYVLPPPKSSAAKSAAAIPPIDTAEPVAKSDVPTTLQELWKEQTVDGENAVVEKGTAGFFKISSRASGASVYAFHNAAARGTVMRVRNLNNGRVIYVKVLGPLPDTKQFAGCVLGLSGGAKAALGVQETKAFCEMSYAGY